MLKRVARVAFLALLAVLGCDPQQPREVPEPQPTSGRPFVAVYFEHGARLVPEYRPLGDGDPARSVWALLAAGPKDPELTSAIERPDDLLQVAEPEEGRILLELSNDFWSAPDEIVYRAAAQIVFSMSSVEGGRAVTLIDGIQPGTVRTPKGELLEQPLETSHFPAPLVQVVQPVAGATVGSEIPVELNLSPNRRVSASLVVDGKTVATTVIRNGRGELTVDEPVTGPATLRLEVLPQLSLELALRLVNPQS